MENISTINPSEIGPSRREDINLAKYAAQPCGDIAS